MEENKIIEEVSLGTSLSLLGALVSPEIIHGLSVIAVSILSTVAIHFTRKLLNK